jgi:hypothetical protein
MSDECVELKNIKYQTMLLNGNHKIDSNAKNSDNLIDFLNKESELNTLKPWNKLGKGTKIKKLCEYIDKYSINHKLPQSKKELLKEYLLKCLDRKKLQRVKDISYDKNNGVIKAIPGLLFQKNKFTIKRTDKKNNTLKGLATFKHKKIKVVDKKINKNKKTSKRKKKEN